jgi:hypothetical protein|tara:strand:- start:4590 stop:4817 length:228 start_codon:yes stop_codon:yes gene_type:complete
MADIDVANELEIVTQELTKMVEEAQKVEGNLKQISQQIQQLNGVAMYLRGKQPATPVGSEEDSEADMETDTTQEE